MLTLGKLAIAAALIVLGGCASTTASVPANAGDERNMRDLLLSDSTAEIADGDPPPPSQREEARGEAVPIPGSELVRGKATLTVKAPIRRVRKTVLGFDRYHEFMPHYRPSRTLGRTPDGGREVYMQVAVLHGTVRLWARIEMPKPKMVGDVEVHESQFIEGNVKDFKAIWRMRRIDAHRTELSLEVFLNPRIPLPTRMTNEENIDGAVNGLIAMRNRIEGR